MRILSILSRFGGRHPWLTVLIALAWAGVMGYFAAGVQVDNSYDSYFVAGDDSFEAYKSFQKDFGSDEFVYVIYRSRGEDSLLSSQVSETADSLGRALGRVPWAGKVSSLTSTGLVKGMDDELRIMNLEEMRQDSTLRAGIREWLSRKDYLRGNLFTSDFEWGGIFVEMTSTFLDTAAESNSYSRTVHDSVQAILARPEFASLELVAVGDPLINHVYNKMNQDESSLAIGLSIAVVLAVVAFATRSWRKSVLVLALVLLSLVSSLGIMGILGWKMNLLFVILPSLLLTISLAEAIHLIHSGDQAVGAGSARAEAADHAAAATGGASFFTWITTILGFLSMMITPIQAVREFAVYTSFGLTVNFIANYLLTPLCLDRRPSRKVSGEPPRFVLGLVELAIRRPRAVVAVSAAVVLFFAAGIPRLQIESNWIEEFSDRVPVKHAYERVNEIFGGTGSFSLLLEGQGDSLLSPANLHAMEQFQRYAETLPGVSKTISLADLVRDVNAAFHADDSAHRSIPASTAEVSQYLMAYEMSGGEDLDDYLTRDRSKSQLTVRIRMGNTNALLQVFDSLQAKANTLFPGRNPKMTGISSLSVKMAHYIEIGQVQGFGFAVVTIALCMIAAMWSFRLGILSMIPNLLPIVLVLGLMGWAGIRLDYVKMLIDAIALGLAVDDTIHFWRKYRMKRGEGLDAADACRKVVQLHGKPLWLSAVALSLGFLVNLMSGMSSLVWFGILTALVIACAFVTELLVGPAILVLFDRDGDEAARGGARRAARAEVAAATGRGKP